ncbi:MAG TPA: hypothetical protein VKN18_25205 [Blastocatellia bacterium]|nr:hypothetical protein [Blastocatellia bacterium]
MNVPGAEQRVFYDRQLLLGEKRNALLELWEVQQYGIDSYGDPDYVSIYGMRPSEWYAKGIRVLGRTAVECTRDKLADAIGKEVAATAATAPVTAPPLVIDPFAGSGNTLYWLSRHLPRARTRGFELDDSVFQITQQNVKTLGLPIEIENTDYQSGLTAEPIGADQLLITFIAPPWGDALEKAAGLDLRRTVPPIIEIVDLLLQRFQANRLLFAVQVYETVNPISLAELKKRFDWSDLQVYDLNAPSQNHGILVGTKGWSP